MNSLRRSLALSTRRSPSSLNLPQLSYYSNSSVDERNATTVSTVTRTLPQLKLPSSSSVWPRPKEILFQTKVANSVNLIGYVDQPIQTQFSPDGKFWAATSINQELSTDSDYLSLRIPVIFEGDLAHVADRHLKKGHCICIAGQLSADPPPFCVIPDQYLQVMAHTISFVRGSSSMKKNNIPRKQEKGTLKDSAAAAANEGIVMNCKNRDKRNSRCS